jgi:hypothetical protein
MGKKAFAKGNGIVFGGSEDRNIIRSRVGLWIFCERFYVNEVLIGLNPLNIHLFPSVAEY